MHLRLPDHRVCHAQGPIHNNTMKLADFLRRLNQDGYGGIVALELQPDVLGAGDDNRVLANLWAAVDFYKGHFAREGC
jgi:hypothetical protein